MAERAAVKAESSGEERGHRSRTRRARRWLRWSLALLTITILACGAVATRIVRGWMEEGAELARQHVRYEKTHPGWSFPGRIYAPAVPVKDQRPERLLAEARARDYVEDCSVTPPPRGAFCAETGSVTPRDGDSLEPVLLGWLIGPDAELRAHLPLEEAPPHLLHAIVASEDRDFWEHSGINLKAIVRASLANVKERGFAQGGSTLSMQVVRSLTGRREKEVWRKLREMGLAMGLDRELGKRGVLQLYLDAPYLGQRGGLSVCGFEAAAWHYFGKEARALTELEAAALVALLPSPGSLGPKLGTDSVRPRIARVLRAMGSPEAETRSAEVAPIAPLPLPERHPAYLSAARLFLERTLPPEALYARGLRVHVPMDLPLQLETERLFPEALSRLRQSEAGAPLQAAGVALDAHSGELRAIWGGTDLDATGFNRALQARRQPGSAFKPLVFALAFEQRLDDGSPRYTAASTARNDLRTFDTPQGPWRPRNIDWKYSPTASLAYAMVWSQNVATASLLEELGGPAPLIAFAQRLGFDTSRFPEEYGLALGQAETTVLEMTEFAALLANGGRRVEGLPVLDAVDLTGRAWLTGRDLPTEPAQVLDQEAAALTRELMRGTILEGTGRTSRGRAGTEGYRGDAFAKTGTTDGQRDVWFVGGTPSLAMSVWVGHDTPAKLGGNAMELAAPLWGQWMARALPDLQHTARFAEEPAIERHAICTVSGRLPNTSCRTVGAPFLRGTEPAERCAHEHPPEEEAEGPAHVSSTPLDAPPDERNESGLGGSGSEGESGWVPPAPAEGVRAP